MNARLLLPLLCAVLFVACEGTDPAVIDGDSIAMTDDVVVDPDELLAEGDPPADDAFLPDVEALETPFAGETGFVAIEPVTYFLRTTPGAAGAKYVSDEARLWYSFQPADGGSAGKPLAVFFNGGPGSATGLLLAYNTGRRSMDPAFNGGEVVGDNPHRWNRFANTLHIDARNTGFSYSIIGDKPGFTTRNFNPFLDGADFVRVLLRFLAAHPALRGEPVIMAGESYGGTRSIVMLNLLLNPERYAGKEGYYTDESLAAEIAAHYAAVFPDGTVTRAERAEQFGYTALVQPLLFGEPQNIVSGELMEEPGSVIHQIAAEEGATFIPCPADDVDCDKFYNAILFVDGLGRDLYKYDEQAGWMDSLMDPVIPNLLTRIHYADLLGHDPLFVESMYAEDRRDAYKIASPVSSFSPLAPAEKKIFSLHWYLLSLRYAAEGDPEKEFRSLFGSLDDYDAYYVSLNRKVNESFYRHRIHPFHRLFGELFLENLLDVDTLVSQAALDLVIFSPAVPGAARLFDQVAEVTTAADSFTVSYVAGAFDGVGEGTTRTVAFPRYPTAGHSVTVSVPDAFSDDVAAWYGSLTGR